MKTKRDEAALRKAVVNYLFSHRDCVERERLGEAYAVSVIGHVAKQSKLELTVLKHLRGRASAIALRRALS